jgi:hypothetical protein
MTSKNTEPSKSPGLFKRLTGTSFPNPFRKVNEVPVPQSQENREETDRIKAERDKERNEGSARWHFADLKKWNKDFFNLAVNIKKLERRLRQYNRELAIYEGNNNIDSKLATQAKINKINEDLKKLKKDYKFWFNTYTQGYDELLIQLINDYINDKNDIELTTEMYYALKKPNNTDEIKFLLEEGVNPISQIPNTRPFIFDAIMTPNNSENIRTLVNAGADINSRVNYSDNPLFMASRLPNNSENISTLLELGADPSVINMSRVHPTNHDIIEKEKIYQSRKPYLQMVEGTPEAQGHIANFLTNEYLMRNISQYMNTDKGGKKTNRRQKNHQKTIKSKKRKSGKSCKRKTRK